MSGKRESGKAGNDRAWSYSKNKSVMSEKRESGKEGNDRTWSYSKNKSVMVERKRNTTMHQFIYMYN